MSNHNRQRGALSGWAKRRLGGAPADDPAAKGEQDAEAVSDLEGEQLPNPERSGPQRIHRRGT
jgi:hypothetical protein